MKTLNLKPAKEEASVKTPPSCHPLLHPDTLLTALMTLNGLWYNTRGVVLGSLYKQKSQSGPVLKKTAFFSFFLSPSLPSVPPFFFFFATSYRILFPRPGMEPTLPALLLWSPSHWTAREVPRRLHSCGSQTEQTKDQVMRLEQTYNQSSGSRERAGCLVGKVVQRRPVSGSGVGWILNSLCWPDKGIPDKDTEKSRHVFLP